MKDVQKGGIEHKDEDKCRLLIFSQLTFSYALWKHIQELEQAQKTIDSVDYMT